MASLGQIHRGTVLGNAIYELCKNENINIIVDIGTWNGMGTTKCVIDAMNDSNKLNYNLISLECRLNLIEEAKKNLGNIPNLHLIHGSIVNYKELECLIDNLEWGIVKNNKWIKEDNSIALKWLKEDIELLKNTPNVLNEIPNEIDLLIIDGSEFSGYLDFIKLYKRSKYIAMDDIISFKNYKSRQYVYNNINEFKILLDDLAHNCFVCKNLL